MRVHDLKLNSKYWFDVKNGIKTFELRLNDRDFQCGDDIVFKMVGKDGRYVTHKNYETGYTEPITMNARITYFLQDEQFLQDGYCALGIGIIKGK